MRRSAVGGRRVTRILRAAVAGRSAAERLEGRALFAAVAWTGGTGDWSDATKWSTGAIPAGDSDVTIPAGANVTVTTADSSEDSGTITAAAGSTLTVQTGSTLTARNGATINGTFVWAGGFGGYGGATLTVAGTTTVTGYTNGGAFVNTGTIAFDGGGVSDGTFANQGTATMTGGMLLGGNAAFTNAAGATLTQTDDVGFIPTTYPYVTVGTFVNSGTFTKNGGTGTSVFPDYHGNAGGQGGTFEDLGGTIHVDTGTYVVQQRAAFAGTTFDVAAGSTFRTAQAAGDTTSSYNIQISGTLTGTGGGTVALDQGDFVPELLDRSDADATLNFPDGMLTVGPVYFNPENGSTARTINAGFMTVNNPDGSGSLDLFNQGTLRSVGPGDLPLSESTNDTTGVIDLTTDGGLSLGAGSVNNTNLTNKGVIRKAGTSGTSVMTATFLNDGGTLDVETGTLSFREGRIAYLAGGPVTVAAGAVLNFADQYDVSLQGTLSSTGAGTVTVTSGGFDGPSTVVDGLDPTATGTLDFAPNALYFRGGYIDQSRGTIVNAGTAYFQGGGPMSNTDNAGTIYVDGGQYAPVKGTLITNEAAGSIILTGATSIVTGVNCHVVNAGLIQVNAGSGGTVDLATPFPYSIYSDSAGIANTGTVEVASGTVTYPATSLGAAVGTIDTGTYQVDAGASLLSDTADAITTTNGTVVLNGNGYFPDVAGLATVGGGFTVGPGATFATAGSLAVPGTLTVGGKLTVSGGLAQTGTLAFAVSGPPGGAGAPSLTVTGATSLAGTLAAAETGGYGATAGIPFPVATFASAATGGFASTAGVAPSFTAAVTPTTIVLNSTGVAGSPTGTPTPTGTADLGVTSVTGPTTGSPGSAAAISWVVTNAGTGAATGTWHDSVYLTTNGTLDNNAVLLGRVAQAGPVAAGGTYTGTLTVALPAVPVAAYQIVVLTDSGQAVSDTDRTDNAGASAAFTTTIPSLTLSNTTRGTITQGGDVLYRLTAPAGNDVVLAATFDVATEADLYVSYAAIPTTTSFDESLPATTLTLTTGTSTTGSLLIPVHQAGDYYVLVHGREGATATPGFTLRPAQLGFSAQSISPTSGGVLIDETVTIKGSDFTGRTTVSFIPTSGSASQSATLTPISTHLVDSNTLLATFRLTNPAPTYQVVVTDGTQSVTLATPFTTSVKIGSAFQYYLTVPSVSRGDLTGTAYLHYSNPDYYSNAGGGDIPAQYFYVSAPNTNFRLVGDPTYSQGSLEVLGIAQSGDAGVLAPGASGVIPIQYTQTSIQSHQAVDISVSQIDPNASIDLSALKADLKPAGEPQDAWDAIYANFLTAAGSTVGGLSTLLANAATALGYQGTYTPDVSVLMHYALKAAGGFGTISQRYNLGAFGRGQSDPFAHAVAADADGNVTVTSGGRGRVFLLQANGTYQGLDADTATLTLAGGVYTLAETTGAKTVFNADGTLNYSQDANGNRLTAAYAGARLSTLTATDGDVYTFTYNAANLVSQVTDPEGRPTTYTYDPADQLLDSVTSTAGTTSFTYVTDPTSPARYAVTSITYPDGLSQTYTYDALGRLAGESDTGGAVPTTYAYDALGTTVTTTDALGQPSTETMGPTGAPVQIGDALGNIGRMAYTATGRVASETSAGGFATTTTYDAAGDPTAVTTADGATVHFSYDPTLQQLISLTDPKGNKTSLGYDSSGHVISDTDAAGQTTTYAYNAVGLVTGSSSPAGRTVSTAYDAHGLVTGRTYADGTSITYTYDAHRNLTSATDATGTVSYAYDAADRLTSVTYPGGLSLTYAYDAAGRRTRMTDQTGFTTGYVYNSIGQLSSLTDTAGHTIAAYAYDADGRLVRQDNANGSDSEYTYDAAGEVTTVTNHAAGGGVSSSFAYAYDADGQRSSVTSLAGTTTYAYDPVGQLTAVVLPGGRTISYAYDPAGNRSVVSGTAAGPVTYAANDLNQYVTVGGTTYTYDADGNLTAATDPSGTTTYAYDARGLLASIASPTGTQTFGYDAVGDRISTTVAGVTTLMLDDPDGNDVVGQFDAAGTPLTRYTYGNGLTSAVSAAGASSFYAFDGSGNTADVTGSGGATAVSYTYLPFGQVLSQTGSSSQPFTFGGAAGVTGDGGGLYYMRARTYDSATGRFLQRDPQGLIGDAVNLYRYAGNDPVNHGDPTGFVDVATTPGPIYEKVDQLLRFLGEKAEGLVVQPQNWQRLELGALQNIEEALTANAGKSVTSYVNGITSTLGSEFATATFEGISLTTLVPQLADQALALEATNLANVSAAVAIKATSEMALVSGGLVTGSLTTGLTTGAVTAEFTTTALGLTQVVYDAMKAVADANRFNNEFPDGIPLQVQEALTGTAYANAIKQPLAHELIRNLQNQGVTPSDDFIAAAIQADADLVRARNRANTTTLQWATMFVNANDPNDIIGPAGYGPAGFVPAGGTFPYEVTFENKATASAPAKTVTITEQLDANLDWTTFQLTGMGFGAYTVDVPAGLTSYATTVVLAANLRVDVVAALDTLTGVLTWTFTSIDPTTGDSPADALVGFLPPDDAAGNGAGYVTYTVNPKAGLATGATVRAQASIVFDGNAALATPLIVNTIDAAGPTSTVTALAATQTSTRFRVSWTGADDAGGSGIAVYTILVSVDGGGFTVWTQDRAGAGSAVFAGSPGHTYAFESVARDGAGNGEVTPAAAQATTAVPAVARTLTVTKGKPTRFTDAAGNAVTVTLSGPGSGVLSFLTTGNGDPVSFVLTGTTAATRVTVNAAGKAGTLTLTDVSAAGSLAAFTAPTADLAGSFAVAGTLGALSLDNAADAAVTVGGAGVATTFRVGTLHDVTLTTAAAIKSLSVAGWTDGPLATDARTAPSIGTLTVAGNVDADLTLTGTGVPLRAAAVRGAVTGGTWTAAAIGSLKIGGNLSAATITLTGAAGVDLATLSVAGTVSGSTIAAAAGVGTVAVGGMAGSTLFAGVAAGATGLPTAAADLSATGSIRSFAARGRSPFAGSDVAAHSIGTVTLSDVTTDDGGVIFGVAAHAVAGFALDQPRARPVRLAGKQLASTLAALGGDLRVEVL